MRRVEDSTLSVIKPFFDEAARVASGASCLRARCGSVIVATTGETIGSGYNAPPLEDETQRACEIIHNLEKSQNTTKHVAYTQNGMQSLMPANQHLTKYLSLRYTSCE